MNELKKYGLKDKEKLFDPITGKTIDSAPVGISYFYKLHHTAEGKEGARSTGNYTMDELPAAGGYSGSKKLGGLLLGAIVTHDSDEVLKDFKLIKGRKNADFWRDFKLGRTPATPDTPLVYRKFLESIRGSGITVREGRDAINVFAMTDKDARELTGDREVTSADTYDSKSFQPIDNGLFGRNVFGNDGNRWGYIQMDEPVLNPVMEKPVRLMLGMTQTELYSVIAGKKQLNNKMTGGAGLMKALASVNAAQEMEKAKDLIKNGSASKRGDAIAKFRYLYAMQKHGVKPEDFMLTRVPVIPPRFRPIVDTNDFTIVSDPNYLYKELVEARDDLREARGTLPDEMLGDARARIYNAFRTVVGTKDPDNTKLVNKNVGGFFQWMFGKKSPKSGAYQRSVIGTTVDVAGRSVITPNASLKLDEVGMPESQAWTIYSPFTIRGLVRKGIPATQALKMVENRSREARDMMEDVMRSRPLIITRAPALHKFSVLAVRPKLIKGHTLQVSPALTLPPNADFDGNCCDFDSEIILRLSKSELDKYDVGLYCIFMEQSIGNYNKGEQIMRVIEDAKVTTRNAQHQIVTMKIGDVPRLGNAVKDRNGADVFTLPDGIEVLSYDVKTNEPVFKKAMRLTVEQNCPVVEVKTRTREVIVSDNESLAVFDHSTGGLIKIRPADAKGRMVPVLHKSAYRFGNAGDRDLGWWIGSFLSDGWVTDSRMVGYSKNEKRKRDEFIRITREKIDNNFYAREYSQDKGDNKLGNSIKLHLNSPELAGKVEKMQLSTPNPGRGVRQAVTKRLHDWYIDNGSEEFLWGILSGLLDGDGSIVRNTAMEKPRYNFRMNTSSPGLKDSTLSLCARLGLRAGVTTVPPRGHSGESYVICISTVDMHRSIDKLSCVGVREKEICDEFKSSTINTKVTADQIPLTFGEVDILKKILICAHNGAYVSLMKSAKAGTPVLHVDKLRELHDELSGAERDMISELWIRAMSDAVKWEPVKIVTPLDSRQVFDLEVEDTKVFAVNRGMIIWDTMSYYVPVTQKAVDDAYKKMLPSKNLLSARWFDAHFKPEEEYVMGLFLATRKKQGQVKRKFNTYNEALKAYRLGEIEADDNIVIEGQ
jgi:hypothetical protein